MNRESMTSTVVKLGIFVVITGLCTLLVGNTLYRPLGQSATTYRAAFTDVVGLKQGSDVRIAGVRVGRVNGLELTGEHATVTFEVTDDQTLPADVEAHVRYADLLGARYIALQPGSGTASGSGEPLPDGAVIPLNRTRPAVDLTELFNGFQPVFNTLQPEEINTLARHLIAVFEGQGGTIDSLLSHVVALTTSVADQDKLIGEVLTNLNKVTDFALRNEPDFTRLVDSLASLTKRMAASRKQIGTVIDASSELARGLSGLVTDLRPALDNDLRSLDRFAGTLADNSDEFASTIQAAPELFTSVNRVAEYGAWVNVYLCTLIIESGAPLLGDIDTGVGPHSEVCQA
ncbi:MCE family protein [Haloechinothrix halophila]|uniref:MCE family protein n=1 Tax=Haloechinothrix halophila TaxID=1069073 RepID=UPI0003F677BB|nr:MCE family protein [Haloechinothrix halophila]